MSLCRANYVSLVFAATFAVGVASAYIFSDKSSSISSVDVSSNNIPSKQLSGRSPEGIGISGRNKLPPKNFYEDQLSRLFDETPSSKKSMSDSTRKDLKMLSTPKPRYTAEAKRNGIEGNVVLRVTFLASGEIGEIRVIKELPDGLTEKAIAAARNIKFEPRMDNGVKISVSKSVSYSFTIY